jgi:hypothetical protein
MKITFDIRSKNLLFENEVGITDIGFPIQNLLDEMKNPTLECEVNVCPIRGIISEGNVCLSFEYTNDGSLSWSRQ